MASLSLRMKGLPVVGMNPLAPVKTANKSAHATHSLFHTSWSVVSASENVVVPDGDGRRMMLLMNLKSSSRYNNVLVLVLVLPKPVTI